MKHRRQGQQVDQEYCRDQRSSLLCQLCGGLLCERVDRQYYYFFLALLVLTVVLNALFLSSDMMKTPSVTPLHLIVVAPTFYSSLQEERYLLGVESCRQAAKHGLRLILVDGSPMDEVRAGLENAGKDAKGSAFVRVIPQVAAGKKGVALREAINAAWQEFKDAGKAPTGAVIAFQELEKVDMISHWKSLTNHMAQSEASITVPRRSLASFQESYPREQFYAETFANLYLDSLGAKIGLTSIDWTMGPMAVRASYAYHWLDYDGQIWDAQIAPMIHAHLAGASVTSFEVDYRHPELMKKQEEGVPGWSEKRLLQLNFLHDSIGKLLKEKAQVA